MSSVKRQQEGIVDIYSELRSKNELYVPLSAEEIRILKVQATKRRMNFKDYCRSKLFDELS
jgi:hypothetical protein